MATPISAGARHVTIQATGLGVGTGPQGPQGEQGLPGLNGVPTDEAVAAYIAAPGTDIRTELDDLYARRHYDVKAYGAVGDGITDDTTAIKAAIDAARIVRGIVYFPRGLYLVSDTLTCHSNVIWRGDGPGISRLLLADDSDVDLVRSVDFATLTGGSSQSGPDRFGIIGMRLDGNGANQAAESWTFRVYGRSYYMTDVEIINGRDGNVYSEWGTGGTDMEAHWTNFKIGSAVNGPGIDWRGPHDTTFANGFVYKNGEATSTWDGIRTSGNAGGEMFSNVHVWGAHLNSWNIRKLAQATSCVGEGAKEANVLIAATRTVWNGHIYGRGAGDSATEVGIQIGDGTSGGITGYSVLASTWNYLNAASIPVKFVADSGGSMVISVNKGSATSARSGSVHTATQLLLTCVDNPTESIILAQRISTSSSALAWSAADASAVRARLSGSTFQIGNGSELRGYSDNFSTETYRIYANGAVKARAVATGSRPAATSVAAGSQIYDTTLGKPIWSDGTVWRDAAGTSV